MKIFSSKLQRNLFIGIFVAQSIAFMLVLPTGSFDPATWGFWRCIIQSLVVSSWGIWSIFKALNYANKKWGTGSQE
jgi:hypothetical protein